MFSYKLRIKILCKNFKIVNKSLFKRKKVGDFEEFLKGFIDLTLWGDWDWLLIQSFGHYGRWSWGKWREKWKFLKELEKILLRFQKVEQNLEFI